MPCRCRSPSPRKRSRASRSTTCNRSSVISPYEGKGVPEGKKSVAISVRVQPKEATLTEGDIEAFVQKVVASVTKATNAVLRT